MKSVSVVIYGFNEAENVARSVREAKGFLDNSVEDYEVLVVDDGSTDGTAEAAESVVQEAPDRMRVLRHPTNRGIGEALRTGFGAARKDWLVALPADGQVPPEELAQLFDVLAQDPQLDLVTCHFPDRFEEADGPLRRLLSRGLRLVLWLATGVGRPMDGVYLVRREIVEGLSLRSETFFYNLELPIRAIRQGAQAGATTLHIRPRQAGSSKVLNFNRMRRVLGETLALGLELRLGRD